MHKEFCGNIFLLPLFLVYVFLERLGCAFCVKASHFITNNDDWFCLSDTMASSNGLFFDKWVPMWTVKLYLVVVRL
jgi:hypothetical protein